MDFKDVAGLLEEVVFSHRDPNSTEYNGCEEDECLWCEQAAEAIRALKRWQETRVQL